MSIVAPSTGILPLQFHPLQGVLPLLKGVKIGGNYMGAEAFPQDFKLLTQPLTFRLELTD